MTYAPDAFQADRAYILEALERNATRVKRAGWPGMPVSNFPMSTFGSLNTMIAHGTVVEIKRASTTRHGQTVSYIACPEA
jgi:hypothetical protein